ncbi:hypothetical protein [Sinorhizobium sp. BG8]|uniref:hypothetical protein n=1 Tax=Sinorhizobium sp. BG8 TaxID=2613773 RepID=UPI00193D3EE9|nr:hypothetical protein [Sinorhizobium sp. BG8]QRM54731.1 hypothetical protein F3Y30_09385 [Sinorhizobium sp. BG8]
MRVWSILPATYLLIALPAGAVTMPSCDALASFNWEQSLVSDNDTAQLFGDPITDFSPEDFVALKGAIQQCANDTPGDNFATYNERHLERSLFMRIDEAQAQLPELRNQREAEEFYVENKADLEGLEEKVGVRNDDGYESVLTSDEESLLKDITDGIESRHRVDSSVWMNATVPLLEQAAKIKDRNASAHENNRGVDQQQQAKAAEAERSEQMAKRAEEINQSNESSIFHHPEPSRELEVLQDLYMTFMVGNLCAENQESFTADEMESVEAEIGKFVASTPTPKSDRDKIWYAMEQSFNAYKGRMTTSDCALTKDRAAQLMPKIFQDPNKLGASNPF